VRTLVEPVRSLSQRALAILGFSQVEGRDVDLEQAFLRVVVTAIVLIYGTIAGLVENEFSLELRIALACGLVTGSAGVWMLFRFHRHPARPASLRSFGIAADLIPITAGLFLAGEIGVPLVGLYLWITVGNGFRFGPRYLLQSYALSGVCFSILLFFAPFWQQHRAIGVGLAIVLGTIPLYVLVLLSRLTAQKEAAEQLSNAKSRFVANVSHELRTPLTGVVAVHDLLLRRDLPSEVRDLVGTLGKAIQALKTSVDAILQMSKLEAGAEQVTVQPFNLRSYLGELGGRVTPEARAKNLQWSYAVEDNVPGTVVGDQSHLSHIVGNLINNALKFTSSGSVRLHVARSGSKVRFDVIDTGIGIPFEKQSNIFERFVQADSSATRRFGGTGLGTSIAHDLVKLMGGAIGLTSKEGEGSTFWFELPLCPEGHLADGMALTSDQREVYVIGDELADADDTARGLRGYGARSRVVLPAYATDMSFSAEDVRTAVLRMTPQRAIAFAEQFLTDALACPWLLIATTKPTSTELSRIWALGAKDVFPHSAPDSQVCVAVAALTSIAVSGKPALTKLVVARRILIADDNQSNLLLIARILEHAGHSVRTVERGDIAYDLMMSGQFDAALLDYNMPEMTGPDAVKLFRAGEVGSTERLPILIVSADATPTAKRSSIEAGADGHVTKPVAAQELLELITTLTVGQPPRVERRAGKREYPRLVPQTKQGLDSTVVLENNCADNALVDPERFSDLKCIAKNDIEFMRKYTEASFSDIEAAIAELRLALGSGDEQAAREALHKIDGTAANLGAKALGDASIRMKRHLCDPQSTFAVQAAAEIASTCALTKSALTAALAQTAAQENNDTARGA